MGGRGAIGGSGVGVDDHYCKLSTLCKPRESNNMKRQPRTRLLLFLSSIRSFVGVLRSFIHTRPPRLGPQGDRPAASTPSYVYHYCTHPQTRPQCKPRILKRMHVRTTSAAIILPLPSLSSLAWESTTNDAAAQPPNTPFPLLVSPRPPSDPRRQYRQNENTSRRRAINTCILCYNLLETRPGRGPCAPRGTPSR